MNKKAMSLVTLAITITVMIIIAGAIMMSMNNMNIIQKAENVVEDMDLKNMQQLANMAYANIYFDNLTKGIRRELTAEEISERIKKSGIAQEKLELYQITVENGDVFVAFKEEK